MGKSLVVAASCLNQTPLDWEGNYSRMRRATEEARALGAQLLVLPELCVSGYGCEDAFFSVDVHRRSLKQTLRLAIEVPQMLVLCGLPLLLDGQRYNVAAVLGEGGIKGIVPKQHLANYGIHYETRWFEPWPSGKREIVRIEGQQVPVGDITFDLGGVLLGVEICHDAWVEHRPGVELVKRGCKLLANLSASHFAFGKHLEREEKMREWSKDVAYIYANALGNEAGRAIYDGITVIAERGEVLQRGERFSFAEVRTIAQQLQVEEVSARGDIPCVLASSQAALIPRSREAAWSGKFEEFSRVVALGLFDYLRKSRSQGFVVSMSGGADSAGTSLLVATMVRLATLELGVEGFLKRLDYIPGLSAENLMARLLTCVYQSTTNSSETTRVAAQKVSETLGATFCVFDISEIVSGYTSRVEEALGYKLNWEEHDLALQNIQARTRSPGVWMIANLNNALLLSTSNRSEAAVGYTTMDGDTSGGLSPVAGIDKAFLREWLSWYEVSGPLGLSPLSELSYVNAQAPTAELRPGGQSDEDDLMPYPLLDRIERLAIRDKLSPVEVFQSLLEEQTPYEKEQLRSWVRRFFLLWSRNQWKRERFAPSFHLDDENLDPKTWCRFPILSGGFATELEELRLYP